MTYIDKITLAYFDISLQNLPKELKEYSDAPLFVLYPANRDPLDPFHPDGYGTQQIMRYVKDNAINEFDLPKFPHLSTHEFSQTTLGEKVTYQHVIESEERRKAADQAREDKYKIKEDL